MTEFEQIKVRAEQGDADSQHKLGRYYASFDREYHPEASNLCIYWLIKAAEQGDVYGQSLAKAITKKMENEK